MAIYLNDNDIQKLLEDPHSDLFKAKQTGLLESKIACFKELAHIKRAEHEDNLERQSNLYETKEQRAKAAERYQSLSESERYAAKAALLSELTDLSLEDLEKRLASLLNELSAINQNINFTNQHLHQLAEQSAQLQSEQGTLAKAQTALNAEATAIKASQATTLVTDLAKNISAENRLIGPAGQKITALDEKTVEGILKTLSVDQLKKYKTIVSSHEQMQGGSLSEQQYRDFANSFAATDRMIDLIKVAAEIDQSINAPFVKQIDKRTHLDENKAAELKAVYVNFADNHLEEKKVEAKQKQVSASFSQMKAQLEKMFEQRDKKEEKIEKVKEVIENIKNQENNTPRSPFAIPTLRRGGK